MKKAIRDQHQTYWQLAGIQAASVGTPTILQGHILASEYGIGTTVTSLIVGSLVLWIIGLATVSMAFKHRDNAVEAVKSFLGRGGGILVALVMMVAFITWFTLQIKAAASISTRLIGSQGWNFIGEIRIGVVLGLACMFLSLGGIRLIKYSCLILFPLQLLYLCSSAFVARNTPFLMGDWGFSLVPTIKVIILLLPGYVLLPTFFRHSHSRGDSALALTLMTISMAVFQAFGFLIQQKVVAYWAGDFANLEKIGALTTSTSIGFVVAACICVNLVNIYFAATGWEALTPKVAGKKEMAILGIIGIVVYAFTQLASVLNTIEALSSAFIASLGAVLIPTFLVKIIVQHRPRSLEKIMSCICWLIGCAASTMARFGWLPLATPPALIGVMSSLLVFMVVVFIEETLWSVREIKGHNRSVEGK